MVRLLDDGTTFIGLSSARPSARLRSIRPLPSLFCNHWHVMARLWADDSSFIGFTISGHFVRLSVRPSGESTISRRQNDLTSPVSQSVRPSVRSPSISPLTVSSFLLLSKFSVKQRRRAYTFPGNQSRGAVFVLDISSRRRHCCC